EHFGNGVLKTAGFQRRLRLAWDSVFCSIGDLYCCSTGPARRAFVRNKASPHPASPANQVFSTPLRESSTAQTPRLTLKPLCRAMQLFSCQKDQKCDLG